MPPWLKHPWYVAASLSVTGDSLPPPRWKLLAGVALITLATCYAYLPALNGGFIWDDELYVTKCDLIKASDGLYRFWFTTQPIDYWPASNSTFWIEWRLWGMNPTGYHVTNLVLHIASSLLLWAILGRLSIPGAWLAALLFAVHPVNVESVAWIAQRKNTLSLLFFLLSILWYLKTDRGGGRWYALSLLAFTLAMLSKGSVAILPLVLLLLAWWQRGSITKRDLVRTAPFFVVAIVFTAVNVWFQTHGADVDLRSAGFAERLAGAGTVVWFYLYKALAPVNLIFIYPQWNIQAGDWRWWLPLAAAVAVTAVLLWKRENRYGRPLLLAWLFFCVALLPVMGFTDVYFMKYSLVADHYQYIALISVMALVAAGWSTWRRYATAPARTVLLALAVSTVAGQMYLAHLQSGIYADSITIFQDTLEKNPACRMAHNNLGSALSEVGRSQDGMEHFLQALRLNPDDPEAHYNLGTTLAKTNRPQEAIEHFQQALRERPNFVKAINNLGIELAKAGRTWEAIQLFQQALRLHPNFTEAENNLGNALNQAGLIQEAIEHYQQALRLNPDYAPAAANLPMAYAQCNRPAEAVAAAQIAIDLARSQKQLALLQQLEAWLANYRSQLSQQPEISSPPVPTSQSP